MSLLTEAYSRSLQKNEAELNFWRDYTQKLEALDFESFASEQKVTSLIPVGSRILYRGELIHTNEITVAIGANYFVKCGVKQANILREHRLTDAKSKTKDLEKERKYLESHLSFTKENFFDHAGEEIIEPYVEEEERQWSKKHKENLKKSKVKEKSIRFSETRDVSDEELWNRLDELEIQEELENELSKSGKTKELKDSNPVTSNENTDYINQQYEHSTENRLEFGALAVKFNNDDSKHLPKKQVLDEAYLKQEELLNRLAEINNKSKQTNSHNDLMSRLDEMEEIESIEDELDRLDEVLEDDDDSENSDAVKSTASNKSVSFADDCETIDIYFEHSDVIPEHGIYDPNKGIQCPDDIYEAYKHLLKSKRKTSILKKGKVSRVENVSNSEPQEIEQTSLLLSNFDSENLERNANIGKPIIVEDVSENVEQEKVDKEEEQRPLSLFKQMRQQRRKKT